MKPQWTRLFRCQGFLWRGDKLGPSGSTFVQAILALVIVKRSSGK